jgi:hypothetical protein
MTRSDMRGTGLLRRKMSAGPYRTLFHPSHFPGWKGGGADSLAPQTAMKAPRKANRGGAERDLAAQAH